MKILYEAYKIINIKKFNFLFDLSLHILLK